MTRAACVNAFAMCLAALAGCLSPATTRLPTLATGPPALERRSFEHFDPYADDKLGPETNTRPPSFENSREPQRKAIEGQFMQGAPAGPVPPGYTNGAYRDSDVVR
ncbi:MAG: hypothetical protein M3552_07700 [Planctomycetota bacterium]|nr:hypothetical protein [Planctomycetaceae bacterium]MDQ3330522.1 hypothetical protein [Planctomycetota bacterium]